MQCPIDQTPLVMAERQGIEIDYCPKCRGIWLDRGELDKIIERAAAMDAAAATPAPPVNPAGKPQVVIVDRDDDDDYRRYGDPNSPTYNPQYRKKKSFWGEVFDVFD